MPFPQAAFVLETDPSEDQPVTRDCDSSLTRDKTDSAEASSNRSTRPFETLQTHDWEACIKSAIEPLAAMETWLGLRDDHLASTSSRTDIWDTARTKLLGAFNEAIIQSILHKSGKTFNLKSSKEEWDMLLDTCECWGSLHSRKMQLILAGAPFEKPMSWEPVLLHVLRRVDDLAIKRKYTYQPEQDALYSSIYLDAVRDLIKAGNMRTSWEDYNVFIARSLLEIWQLNLTGARYETHRQYLDLILKLKPSTKFTASFSPDGLKKIYTRAFQLLAAPANLTVDPGTGSSILRPFTSSIVHQLLDLLFCCHQKTETLSNLSDYYDVVKPILLDFLGTPEGPGPEFIISAILARSLWIAEANGHLKELITSLAHWLPDVEFSDSHTRRHIVALVRGSLHLFMGQ